MVHRCVSAVLATRAELTEGNLLHAFQDLKPRMQSILLALTHGLCFG